MPHFMCFIQLWPSKSKESDSLPKQQQQFISISIYRDSISIKALQVNKIILKTKLM